MPERFLLDAITLFKCGGKVETLKSIKEGILKYNINSMLARYFIEQFFNNNKLPKGGEKWVEGKDWSLYATFFNVTDKFEASKKMKMWVASKRAQYENDVAFIKKWKDFANTNGHIKDFENRHNIQVDLKQTFLRKLVNKYRQSQQCYEVAWLSG